MIIGVNQLDLVRTITQLLASYPEGIANQLRENIFVVGGGSKIKGLS
jgi:actin-related protein